MKKAILFTFSIVIFGVLLAKAQKLNHYALPDTTQSVKGFGLFKLDTSFNKLNNKLLQQPLVYKMNPDEIIALTLYKNLAASPVDHMPIVMLTSADPMPVKRPDANMRYSMPVKKLGNPIIPLTRP